MKVVALLKHRLYHFHSSRIFPSSSSFNISKIRFACEAAAATLQLVINLINFLKVKLLHFKNHAKRQKISNKKRRNTSLKTCVFLVFLFSSIELSHSFFSLLILLMNLNLAAFSLYQRLQTIFGTFLINNVLSFYLSRNEISLEKMQFCVTLLAVTKSSMNLWI